ncbi:hypothetical protein ACHAXT_006643 [Thalassiosira profunda]
MPSPRRLLSLAAVAAAGASLSALLSGAAYRASSVHAPTDDIVGLRGPTARRLLASQLGVYGDPKTVSHRPKVDNLGARNDGGVLRAAAQVPSAVEGVPVLADTDEELLAKWAPDGANGPLQDATEFDAPKAPLAAGANSLVPLPPDAPPPIVALQPIANNVVAPPPEEGPRTTYTIDNALATPQAFRYTLFFFVYDSASDSFVIIHNIKGCDHGCQRIYRAASLVALAFRSNFPERFRGTKSDDLVVMMSTGDAPRIKIGCLRASNNYCHSVDFAPILNFGSVFVTEQLLPTMVAMPLPVRPHAPCFDEWQVSGSQRGEVCQDLRPKTDFGDNSLKGGLVFGNELGLLEKENYWDELIPQVIWRGTDFVFLHTMFQEMRAPEYKVDIAPKEATKPQNGSPEDEKRWAINTLWEMGNKLLPRWRGVLLTSEAEIDAQQHEKTTGEPALPWANIKFANLNTGGVKVAAADHPEYQTLQKLGIACIGERVEMTEQARYRYHLDIGGGGGTTWTGTIEKLALPGVLFHHVTPTKDYFHQLLEPWVHYIPVKTDLSDLREKYEWAEEHPDEARKIAEAGTEFARWMGSPAGFGKMHDDFLVAPLRNVIEGYRPMPEQYAGRSVMDVLNEVGAKEGYSIVGRCSGKHSNSCESVV